MKSAWPGVSIRLMLCGVAERGADAGTCEGCDGAWEPVVDGGQEKEMAADWMVMPRARSAGRKSVTVLPSSTSGVCQAGLSRLRRREYE